ncbi:MAG: N-formylglutamate deformylase [Alphaproteobacteria bacterium]|nr:N-formylglutamate deformylase [Alphaproteobacteria bacterium]
MNPVEVRHGDGPVVLGLPHTGLFVPDSVLADLNETGHAFADTDWNIHTLYAGLLPHATTVRATFHRYVIDANRDPAGVSLYPGQNTTGLCPVTDFDNKPIYRDGKQPDEVEIRRRLASFHTPYHAALRAELDRVRSRHGIAVLYDCHSIRSNIPFLFEGTLPDFNIGTNEGTTCAAELESIVAALCAEADGYSSIVNGRFKGGWTTRHYGQPDENIHAIQMELSQRSHLAAEAPPFDLDPQKADHLRGSLGAILTAIESWAFARVHGA